MPKFMITVRHIDGEWDRLTESEREAHGPFLKEFMESLKKEKDSELVFLHPAPTTRTVRRVRDGSIEVSEGPVEQTNEAVGCYYVIDAESLDEALEWAERGRWMVGANEVREIFEGPIA